MGLHESFQKLQAVQVTVTYAGGGDSGSVDEIKAHDKAGKEIDIPSDVAEEIETFVYQHLPGGWEINEGSQGSVVFDIAERTASFNHIENIEDQIPKPFTVEGE